MTTAEWRNKHRRCKYCRHLMHMSLPPFCVGRDTWCSAKMRIVNDEIPRIFCKLFHVKDGADNG